ncbi:MAG: hypothetical protein ACK5O2_05870 [Microthrixaceae bacterium]
MKSRLFCRKSDPAALLRGLASVESCSKRLSTVTREIERQLDEGGAPRRTGTSEATGPTDGQLVLDGLASERDNGDVRLRGALDSVSRAIAEMDACADGLEATIAPMVTDARFSTAGQEHYPELVSIGSPPGATQGAHAYEHDNSRLRLLVASVKDRYSTTIPSLPWIGSERDSFCGPRLTAVRVALEDAEALLVTPVDDVIEIDATLPPSTGEAVIVLPGAGAEAIAS